MAYLPTAVYTAYRGYEWSCLPEGVSREERDALYAKAAALRPEFPPADDVRQGVVTCGSVAAVFRVWNVPAWDADGRSADYFAFAYFPRVGEVSDDDVAALLADPFFHIPERTPHTRIEWRGGEKAEAKAREVHDAKAAPVDARFAELLSRYVERGKRIAAVEADSEEYKRRWRHEVGKCRWWMAAAILLFMFIGVMAWLVMP
jgi:hypothetical protein